MHTYIRKVNYYETDKMGITHHSNYIRWMEEARMDFLKSIGFGMKKLEEDEVTSPVVSIECQYKNPTTFDDEIEIEVCLKKYTGVKLELVYIMRNKETGVEVLTASSTHCFINQNGRPISVKRHFPHFHEVLMSLVE